MARNSRELRCSPDAVFGVLADGWLFPGWVVGATRLRGVDASWPTPGARLHHSFGVWPLVLDDTTVSQGFDAPRRMVLRARGWPAGEAHITIDVEPTVGGCRVTLTERVVSGPAMAVLTALFDVPLRVRNTETLRRLAWHAEGRAGSRR